ncbi:MAG TPA: hypothetical protein PKJ83_13950 [Cyclobacteriaceae bacterium]|nr:hypothetical protein [Cyclobacteriaceae bacterium]HPW63871.1 hypothetical protein [Cyclobacteriaceae bacterium]HRG80341.1 hypothetical protein [Cyclobacteriaceae bacterium]
MAITYWNINDVTIASGPDFMGARSYHFGARGATAKQEQGADQYKNTSLHRW